MKSVQIRIYFWSVFPYIQSEYSKIRTRNNSVFGHFSRGVSYKRSCSLKFRKFHWKLTKFLKTYFEEHLGTAASKFRILEVDQKVAFAVDIVLYMSDLLLWVFSQKYERQSCKLQQ